MFCLLRKVVTFTLATCLATSSAFATNDPQPCPSLNEKQKTVLQQSYNLGKPYDLGYTLATIAFKESSAGVYLINAMTSDYGIFQGNVRTVCSQAGVYHTPFQCNLEIQRIINSIDIAAKHAIETLTYWRNYHQKRSEYAMVYENMIRSYNAGFNFQHADEYWNTFQKNFHMIKQCINFSDTTRRTRNTSLFSTKEE